MLVVRDNGVFEDMISSGNVDAAGVEMHEGIPPGINALLSLEDHLKGQIFKAYRDYFLRLPARNYQTKYECRRAEQLERMMMIADQIFVCMKIWHGGGGWYMHTALSAQIKMQQVFYHSFVELIS